jgi:hypothetical protein
MAKKYKKPENKKHKPRKDLKDYEGKETENMVLDASGEPQPDVPRKIKYSDIGDSENMVYDVKDSDRAYPIKDMQDGDPKMAKHALKTFDKNVEADAKDYIETMSKIDGGYMSKIKKLTKEQKEKLVREIVRKKIQSFIMESELSKVVEQPTEEEPLADTPEPPPAPEAPAIPADAPAPEAPPEAPAPEAPPEAPAPEAPAPEAPPEAPAPEAPPEGEETQGDPNDPDGDGQQGDSRINNFVLAVQQKPNIVQQVKMIMNVVQKITAEDDRKQKIGKIGLLKRVVDRALSKL